MLTRLRRFAAIWFQDEIANNDRLRKPLLTTEARRASPRCRRGPMDGSRSSRIQKVIASDVTRLTRRNWGSREVLKLRLKGSVPRDSLIVFSSSQCSFLVY